jgi:predicted DsbA family dithiol-disulfide isomerase
MQIDIVSETVCPWCFIGKRRIERAMAMRPEVKFEIFWRPYRQCERGSSGSVQ